MHQNYVLLFPQHQAQRCRWTEPTVSRTHQRENRSPRENWTQTPRRDRLRTHNSSKALPSNPCPTALHLPNNNQRMEILPVRRVTSRTTPKAAMRKTVEVRVGARRIRHPMGCRGNPRQDPARGRAATRGPRMRDQMVTMAAGWSWMCRSPRGRPRRRSDSWSTCRTSSTRVETYRESEKLAYRSSKLVEKCIACLKLVCLISDGMFSL